MNLDSLKTRALPFDVKIPNKETIDAMQELDSGNVETFESMTDVWKSVESDDSYTDSLCSFHHWVIKRG